MARWKARTEFLLSVIELLFLSLTVEALQGKTCQNSQPSAVGRSLWAKISWRRGRPWGIVFGFYKTRHILLSNGANCTVLSAAVLTQCRRVTDRRTDGRSDGISVANTALAMRALRALWKLTASGASSPRFRVALPLTSSKSSAPWPHWAPPQIHNPPFSKSWIYHMCNRNFSHNDKFTLLCSEVFKLDTSLTLQIWHRHNLSADIMPILK